MWSHRQRPLPVSPTFFLHMKQRFFFCFGFSRDLLCSSDGCCAASDTEADKNRKAGKFNYSEDNWRQLAVYQQEKGVHIKSQNCLSSTLLFGSAHDYGVHRWPTSAGRTSLLQWLLRLTTDCDYLTKTAPIEVPLGNPTRGPTEGPGVNPIMLQKNHSHVDSLEQREKSNVLRNTKFV